MPRKRFVDAIGAARCRAVICLRDGSTAQCGRRGVVHGLCRQHAKGRYTQRSDDPMPFTGVWQVRVFADGTTAEGADYADLSRAIGLPWDIEADETDLLCVPVDPETGEELR